MTSQFQGKFRNFNKLNRNRRNNNKNNNTTNTNTKNKKTLITFSPLPSTTTSSLPQPKTFNEIMQEKKKKEIQTRKRQVETAQNKNTPIPPQIAKTLEIKPVWDEVLGSNETDKIAKQNTTMSIENKQDLEDIKRIKSTPVIESGDNLRNFEKQQQHQAPRFEDWKREFESFDFSQIEAKLQGDCVLRFYDQLESEIMSMFTN
jgi:hypothetical protein